MRHQIPFKVYAKGTGLATFSAAKINLVLAVTDRRADGFHNLISLVALLGFGDTLSAEVGPVGIPDSIQCDRSEVPVDGTNLILKAVVAFRSNRSLPFSVHFKLTKRIPMGAGLGGGSSNAVAALRLLNALAPNPLSAPELERIASTLGSDCPLFLHPNPLLIRGRGELIEHLAGNATEHLRGLPLLLFMPSFSVSTPWAYQQLALHPENYDTATEIESRLHAWLKNEIGLETLLYNIFQSVVFPKYLILPALFERLERTSISKPLMSGSGSCCFMIGQKGTEFTTEIATIKDMLGPDSLAIATFIA